MLRKNHIYDLDGANNRVEVSGSKGVLLKGEYAMVGDDAKMNRYSTLPGGPGSGQVEERHLSYDLNGNLIGSEVDCLGDANGDHAVDSADLAIISAAYGYSYPDPEYDPRADFDGDGDVDEDDLMVWVNNANTACAYFAFAYDYRNRPVDIEVRHETQQALDPPPPPMHRYGYDAFGRRVERTKNVGAGLARKQMKLGTGTEYRL